jgi:hypothetical protein
MTGNASAKTSVMRISADLSDAAEQVGAMFHRKAAQQIEYWASLGRALETLPGVTHSKIEAALTASLEIDALSDEERAIALARLSHAELTRHAPPMQPSTRGALYARDHRGRLVGVLANGKQQLVSDARLKLQSKSKSKSKPRTR